jgi:hypothetical protein
MNWEGLRRKQSWANQGIIMIFAGGLRKTTRSLRQNSWCSSENSNQVLPVNKIRALALCEPARYLAQYEASSTLFAKRTFA